MAIELLPQEQTGFELMAPTFSAGLQALLNTKMQGLQQQQMGRGLQALGVPGQLAMLPPELLQHIVPKIIEQQGKAGSIDLMKDYFGVKGPQTPIGIPSTTANIKQEVQATSKSTRPSYLPTDEEIARKKAVINKASLQGHEETALKLQAQLDNEIKNILDYETKRSESAIKHEEAAQTRKEKKQQQLEALALKENAPLSKINADLALKATPVVNTIDRIIDLIQNGDVSTGTAVNATPEGLLKTLYGEDTLTAHKELKMLVEMLGKSDVKGMMSRARQQLLESAKPSLYQDPDELIKLLQQYRDEFYPAIRKQEIADQIILDNDKVQPRGLWPMVNQKFSEEQAINDVLKSLDDQGIDISQIPEGTTKRAPRSNVIVKRDSKAPLGFSIVRSKNAK